MLVHSLLYYLHKGSSSQFPGKPIADVSTLRCSVKRTFSLKLKLLHGRMTFSKYCR